MALLQTSLDTPATSTGTHVTIDGSDGAWRVTYALNEVIAIYPITPSSATGEWADQWAAAARALSPDHPVVRGTANKPDVFSQGRESSNAYYLACSTTMRPSEWTAASSWSYRRQKGRQCA